MTAGETAGLLTMMKIKVYINLFMIAGSAIAVVLLLYISSVSDVEGLQFKRVFPPHIVSDIQVFNAGVNSYYLSGEADHQVYLGNSTVPDHVLKVSSNLEDTATLIIPLEKKDTLWGSIQLQADTTAWYLSEPQNAVVRSWSPGQNHISRSAFRSRNIMHMMALNRYTIAGKRYNERNNAVELFKENDSLVTFQIGKGKESLLREDGMLVYAKAAARLLFVYAYRDRFVCLDTSLRVSYQSETIDTTTAAMVSLASVNNNTALTFSGTPPYVHKAAFCNDELLFIHSAIRSAGEHATTFQENILIDAYDIRSGKYQFSFYLPKYRDYPCKSWLAAKDRIFMVFGQYLVSVKFNRHLFRG